MERPVEGSFVREARLAYEYSLNNFIWKQAVFFAERLVAECPCEEMTYLLALAFFHNQETSRAHWHLQGCRLPESRYLLARCCFLLERWEEAEEALFPGSPTRAGSGLGEVVNGAAGLYLLGQVKEKQAKHEQAAECYAKCLELCPFMWDAYERWSWFYGSLPHSRTSTAAGIAANTFSEEKLAQSFLALSGLPPSPATDHPTHSAHHAPPSSTLARPAERGLAASNGGAGGGGARSQNAPPRNEREPPPHHAHGQRKVRSSCAQQQDAGGSRKHRTALGGEVLEKRGGAGPNGVIDHGPEASVSLHVLLSKTGAALHAMHCFDTAQALQLLAALPRRHHDSPYILQLAGMCHFEAADYKLAEQAFTQVWRLEPRRVEGLEYYSTALWHLRKDVELGHLAQQCLQWDRLKPQVWCVVGNSFSLNQEHDVAIKFFKRAIQVDPHFTYAYTLCGHEFVANEKFDKAIPMYEGALKVDPRHYNAWWGLGNIYQRQEEHESAKHHFLRALEINRHNSVLRCYLGMVLDALNSPLLALENLDKATQGEPQNGMAHFQKACVLMSLDRYKEALAELKKVRCLAPKEACVHFQLGKVYMKLQRDRKALMHFNIAMDLNRDSKDYHTIKMHVESLRIRGIREADVDEVPRKRHPRMRSTSLSSAGGDERLPDGRGGERTEQQPVHFLAGHAPVSSSAHGVSGGHMQHSAPVLPRTPVQLAGGGLPTQGATSPPVHGVSHALVPPPHYGHGGRGHSPNGRQVVDPGASGSHVQHSAAVLPPAIHGTPVHLGGGGLPTQGATSPPVHSVSHAFVPPPHYSHGGRGHSPNGRQMVDPGGGNPYAATMGGRSLWSGGRTGSLSVATLHVPQAGRGAATPSSWAGGGGAIHAQPGFRL